MFIENDTSEDRFEPRRGDQALSLIFRAAPPGLERISRGRAGFYKQAAPTELVAGHLRRVVPPPRCGRPKKVPSGRRWVRFAMYKSRTLVEFKVPAILSSGPKESISRPALGSHGRPNICWL